MLKRRLFIGSIGAVALAGGFYAGTAKWHPNRADSSAADTLFALVLPDAQGKPQRLDQWRQQVLVLNFWGTWCPPCLEEMPEFEQVRLSYRGQRVEFIGLAIDNARAVSAFASKQQITYPLLIAGATGTELSRIFGNPAGGLPFTVILDATGQVKHQHTGRLKPERLREMIESALHLTAN
jgi:peroxiredoxin